MHFLPEQICNNQGCFRCAVVVGFDTYIVVLDIAPVSLRKMSAVNGAFMIYFFDNWRQVQR